MPIIISIGLSRSHRLKAEDDVCSTEQMIASLSSPLRLDRFQCHLEPKVHKWKPCPHAKKSRVYRRLATMHDRNIQTAGLRQYRLIAFQPLVGKQETNGRPRSRYTLQFLATQAYKLNFSGFSDIFHRDRSEYSNADLRRMASVTAIGRTRAGGDRPGSDTCHYALRNTRRAYGIMELSLLPAERDIRKFINAVRSNCLLMFIYYILL